MRRQRTDLAPQVHQSLAQGIYFTFSDQAPQIAHHAAGQISVQALNILRSARMTRTCDACNIIYATELNLLTAPSCQKNEKSVCVCVDTCACASVGCMERVEMNVLVGARGCDVSSIL